MGDAQRPVIMPLEVVAVPPDLLLYLPPNRGLVVAGPHVLPVGIDEARPGGRRDRLYAVPVDVLDAPLPELIDELGGSCLQGPGQAQPGCYRSLAAFVPVSASLPLDSQSSCIT